MTTVDRARQVIIKTLPDCKGKPFADVADILLDALLQKRIGLSTMVASADLFKRFHAHCAYLGKHGGEGYEYWYTEAIEHAVAMEDWPMRLYQRTVLIDGQSHMVDVRIPESTKRANNRQLLEAYTVIQDGAKENGLKLPENLEEASDE